jgi:DNA-binding CsgD family transcriptional regulator
VLAGEIPLLGREAEMGRILARLRGREPAAFVLAGPAGVGKTRLAAEVARASAGLGFATAQVVGSRAAAAIPFGPFARFLPESGHGPGELLGLLRQASAAIAGRAGPGGRLLLVVDEAQALDDGSAALVHQLVQAGTCSVLASARTPGTAPELVTALWKDGLAERIDLAAWDEAQTGEVVAAALGGPVSRATVRRLWELSAGNALFLRELLIGAVGSGALSEAGGIWSLGAPLTAPGRLVELVAARLAGLSPETAAVIELLAVGEPVGLPVLEKLTSPQGVEDAEARGLVQVEQDGRRTEARLAHPVYGEALRQALPRSRQRRMLAGLATAVEEAGARRREDLLWLGRWRLDAGGLGDPGLLTRAARRARQVFDLDLAARLAQAALDAGGGAAAGLVLGEARFRAGRHQEAEAVLSAMVPLCRTDRERAAIANARAYALHDLRGDPAAATAVLDEALAAVTEAGPRLQLAGRLAQMRVFGEDPRGALATAEPLLASGDPVMVSWGSYVSSIALALMGRGDEAVRTAGTGLQAHRRARGAWQPPEAQLLGAALGHTAAGRFAVAQADAETGYQAYLAAGYQEEQGPFLLLAGLVLVERGQLAAASRVFLDGASVSREIHDLPALRWCLAGIALAEAMSGHPSRATAAAAERDQLPVEPKTVFETDLIQRGQAWQHVCAGDLPQAQEILVAAADRAAAAGLRVAEARLLHDLARLGAPASAAPRLAALAETIDGDWVAALAGHAAALAAGDAASLETAARALDTLGAALLAAEAFTAAAAAYRAEGLARAATSAARRAAELTADCGDVTTPSLATGLATGRLTRREREVAALAAAGVSSREIADRLVLSVRTVDSHLHSAYTKLGVTSRSELAAALRP